MKEPKDLAELRRLFGMVNYIAKFLPNLTTQVTEVHPLHNIFKKDVTWKWSSVQLEAFSGVKKMLTATPVLAYYDPSKPLTIDNDACEYSL